MAAVAFFIALALAVIATPYVRRLALSTGFVDQPADRKVHDNPVPYLGGIPIIIGTLAAALLGGLSGKIAIAVLAAAVLGTMGLLDDHRSLGSRARLGIAAVAATGVWVAGIDAHVTGVGAVDAVLTVVWIVGITNAVNLLDNMDGLAGGFSAIAAGAVTVLAANAGQGDVARLAAGLAGGCLGFLVYNRRPARIFMGDAGSLFLGFTLAVVVLEVDPNLEPPAGFLIPLLLLALPVLDTTVVTIARVRRRRAVDQGGKDHLSHRLVAKGHSPGRAVWLLLIVELILAAAAIGAGRTALPLPIAAAIGIALLGVVMLRTASADVYTEPVVGLPVPWWGLAAVAVVVVLFAVAPTTAGLLAARRSVEAGGDNAEQALAAAEEGDMRAAAARFDDAREHFQRARSRLEGPLQSIGLVVPVLGSNLRAARTMTDVGSDVSDTGRRLATTLDTVPLRLAGGRLDLGEVRRLAPVLRAASSALRDGSRRMSEARQPYLAGQLDRAVTDLEARMRRSAKGTAVAAEAARLAPAILGGRGPRRYFLAIEDSAELRGSGGFMSHFGELVAVDGTLRLERWGPLNELRSSGTPPTQRTVTMSAELQRRYGQIADLIRGWTHVNAPPDFPTVAGLIRELYPQSGGTTIDGVIAVDPPGLAALLGLAGPITVAGRSEPVSAANVVDAILGDPAASFESRPARETFMGDVGREVWESFTSADVGDARHVANELQDAAIQRHIQVTFFRPTEAAFARALGTAGELPPVQSDALGVVTENGSGTEVDAYLHRSIAYEAEVLPRGSTRATVRGRVRLDFENRSPSSGPEGVIAPADAMLGIRPGQNLSLLSVYSPLEATEATIDGRAVEVTSNREHGRFAHAGLLSVLAGEKASLSMSLAGSVSIHPSGWYSLELHRQPTPSPDAVTVTISVPAGWRIVDTTGFDGPIEERKATTRFQLDQDRRVSVRMQRTGIPGLWDRFRGRWGA